MVGLAMRKALKKLEARKTKERKDQSEPTKLAIIDPSHELSQQRHDSTGSNSDQTSIHSTGLQSDPELHTAYTALSFNASGYNSDGASTFSSSTSPYTRDDDLGDDLNILPFDIQMRTFPTRRRSTGSSRAKSQQKLARILGWNTSFPQRERPISKFSLENVNSSAGTFERQDLIWEDDTVEPADSMSDLDMRQYPTRRAHSMREYSTIPSSHSCEFLPCQFRSAESQNEIKAICQRPLFDQGVSARAESSCSVGSCRRDSNPDVHKPLPSTPAFPTFPTMPPLQNNSTMTSTSTPKSTSQDDFLPHFDLSAEEASILLSQPEPSELWTESSSRPVELSDPTSIYNIRSKSPTNIHTGSSASQYPDFGPGTALSIIEEEPFDADDLAKLKVFELPANSCSHPTEEALNSNPIGETCPSLSPSSSLSSRRMTIQEDETEAQLESQANSIGNEETKLDSLLNSEDAPIDSETEGEDIIVVFDGSSDHHGLEMSGKGFHALDEEDDHNDQINTDENYRNSIQSGESRFICQPIPRSPSIDMDNDNKYDEAFRRSTSVDTTKTSYTNRTTSTTKTLIGQDPDYSTDLAKTMDWI